MKIFGPPIADFLRERAVFLPEVRSGEMLHPVTKAAGRDRSFRRPKRDE